MLRIAICDDEETELRYIADLTGNFLGERGLSAEVREFTHPDTLLSACDATAFHIYMLDMVMPMLSGLALGQSIRRKSTDAQIIYITTEAGFALDAYGQPAALPAETRSGAGVVCRAGAGSGKGGFR